MTLLPLACQEAAGVTIPERELRETAEYNGYSFVGFFMKFLWNHMNDDVEEGIEKISRIFEGNIQWLRAKYTQKEF